MTKKDLRTGHIVTLRNGGQFMVFKNYHSQYNEPVDCIVSFHGTWTELKNYEEDLKNHCFHDLDIVKVSLISHPHNTFCDNRQLTTIWDREEPKQMTVAEIEAILGYKVEIISDQ